MKGWATTKLLAVGALAVLDVVIILFSQMLTLSTGISMASGAILIFTEPILIIICLSIINKFGAATIFMAIISLLTLPTTYSGPPGFLPKIIVIIGLGFAIDSIYWLFKKSPKILTALIIGAIVPFWYTYGIIFVGKLFNIPGIDRILNLLPTPVFLIAMLMAGALAGYLGHLSYQKIKNTSVVIRIQGNE